MGQPERSGTGCTPSPQPYNSPSIALAARTGDILEVWVTFQQKWIFLNKVLYEMKIQFPSADLVGKEGGR